MRPFRRVENSERGLLKEMVRIQRRVSRKRYLNSKRVYEYERVSLHIPRKYHELIKPFLNQDFGVSVAAEKGCIVITLTPQSGPATVSINKLYKHQKKGFFFYYAILVSRTMGVGLKT
jgi:hypothetical protein